MGYIDTILPEQDQPTTYQSIRVVHQANGVPVTSWRSLVNVGLSLTQYVSEAITTGRNLVRGVLRGLFVDSLKEDLASQGETTALVNAATAFALSQYQEARQPSTITVLRVSLTAVSTAPVYNLTSGAVISGTPSTTNALLYTLNENVRLNPSGRVIGLSQAQSPGSAYNLASDSSFELKTTFVGASAAVPASGARLTIGTGNAQLSLHAGPNTANSGLQVAFRIVVDAPNVLTTTVTSAPSGGKTLVTLHSRSDGASIPLTTAEEARGVICSSTTIDLLAGVQLPDGTDGSGAVAILAATDLPLADGPIETAGADAETGTSLLARSVAKWDATAVATGTDDALYYWATKAPTGYDTSPVAQVQVLNAWKSDGTVKGGFITVLMSGSLGPLSGADLTAVTANFYTPRKFANFAQLTVLNATALTINVTADIEYLQTSKLTNTDIADSIAAALLALQARLTMGVQTIDPSLIEAVVGTANTAIWKITLTAPAAPTTLAWNERAAFSMVGFTYTAVLP